MYSDNPEIIKSSNYYKVPPLSKFFTFLQTFPMKNLTTILCLTFATFLASAVVSWSFEFQKSLDTIKSDTFATALKELKRLAKGGDPQAQNNLGVMYRGGLGVPKDDQTAFTWFRLAAERGNAPAP